jgi:hypothetical protein
MDSGWNGRHELLGRENVRTTRIESNHFTMMRDTAVGFLSILQSAVTNENRFAN